MTRLRISFDLDDTLICPASIPAEPPLPVWRRWLVSSEPLRLGAVALLRDLVAHNCSIWIYTTSYRSPRSVRRWLRAYGVRVEGVINQDRHDRVVGRSGPSKYPPAFGIDLHVDDLPGVAIEANRHGFVVVTIAPDDREWVGKIGIAIDEFSPRES